MDFIRKSISKVSIICFIFKLIRFFTKTLQNKTTYTNINSVRIGV